MVVRVDVLVTRGGLKQPQLFIVGHGANHPMVSNATETGKRRNRIVVTEIPYQQARDRVEERIAAMVHDGKIPGIASIRNESDLKEPVRLILGLKRDADPDVDDGHTVTVSDVRFEVDGGQLKLKAGESLDHVSEPTVGVDITATDSGAPALDRTETFQITVTPVLPDAVDDGYAVQEGSALSVPALGLLLTISAPPRSLPWTPPPRPGR